MATGIGVVPNGIGTGEAQVISLPGYQRAMYQKEQQRVKSSQEQKLKDAEELAKMDVNGIHIPDEKIIYDAYKGVTDAYARYAEARTREDRLALKRQLEDAKTEFNFKLATSKERAKKVYSAGERMLSMESNKLTPEQKAYYNKIKNSPSFDTDFDETLLQPKAKPVDIISINKKIRDNSIADKASSMYMGKVGEQDVIVTENGKQLYKPVFAENVNIEMNNNPEYADWLDLKYRKQYESNGGDANNPNDYFKFIVNNEFESQRVLADETKKSASQVRDDNNSTINFGGTSQTRAIPTTQEPSAYLDVNSTFKVIDPQNPTQIKSANRREKIPVYNRVKYPKTFPVDLSESGGYYSIDENKIISPPTEIQDFDAVYILDVPYAETPSGFKPIPDSSVKELKRQGKEGSITYVPSIQGKLGKSENILVRIDQMPETILDEKDFIRAYEKYQQGGGAISGNTQAPAKNTKGKTGELD